MGPPEGMGGQGIVAATAIHRSLKPVRKKGRPSQPHDANDADEDDSIIIPKFLYSGYPDHISVSHQTLFGTNLFRNAKWLNAIFVF